MNTYVTHILSYTYAMDERTIWIFGILDIHRKCNSHKPIFKLLKHISFCVFIRISIRQWPIIHRMDCFYAFGQHTHICVYGCVRANMSMSTLHIYESQNRQYTKLFHWQMNKTYTIHVSGIHNTSIHANIQYINIAISIDGRQACHFPIRPRLKCRFAKLFNLLRNVDPLYFRCTQHWCIEFYVYIELL